MRRRTVCVFSCLLTVILTVAAAEGPAPLQGFTAGSSRAEREWEAKFRAIPDASNMRDYMKRLSAYPHHVGSPYDKENAEWILSRFKEWGWDARIESFDVLFPTPKDRLVQMVEPTEFTAKLEEPTVSVDLTSDQHAQQLPSYNAYSVDGDVTGPLLYVNYGVPEDYEQLERLGISAKGTIAIARYGYSWRGIKPKVAAEHGAIGCLIYSDPRDDGYFEGDVFPRGAYRPKDGVQRGSVMDMPLYPGDPLTPGTGATKDARRLPVKAAPTLTRIPVLPISYGDAEPLLAALKEPVAPEGWRGALPITYHLGPGPAKVHVRIESNWDLKPLYDVVARIQGSTSPENWVIRGNHHDAWVNGAQDPVAALVDELEEARAFGELMKQGWRPKRSIVYCAWDGEEPGLLGSTEWAEEHAQELREHAVVYINTDANSRGYLQMGGSHTLEKFINGVARDIADPETNVSVWERARLNLIRHGSPEERQEARTNADMRIGALGSGSDYTVFLDHLGIASLSLGYAGEDGGGIYHSIYDDFYWYTHFDDPTFAYGRALAQTVGTAVMRLAAAELLPYDFTGFTDAIAKYADELKHLVTSRQDEIRERNKQIEEGVYAATTDPGRTFIPPQAEPVPPYLNFAPMDNAIETLRRSTERYQSTLEKIRAAGDAALARVSLKAVNATLIQSERVLTSTEGLPERPWYKNEVYAPGYYTGYGVKTIPAVREAIEQKKWQEADAAIVEVAKVLENEARLINQAAEQLQ